jgi:hypothetical protein
MTSTIRDQVGVMAIIDQVRHQQSAHDEYLSLNAQKETVRQRVADYYTSQGITVSDAVIDEGIKAWFADRFKAPVYDNNFIVNAYLARPRIKTYLAKWFKAATSATAVVSFCVALVVWFLVNNFQGHVYRSWQAKHQGEVQEAKDLGVWFDDHLPRTPLVRNAAIDAVASEHLFLLMKTRLEADALSKRAAAIEAELQKGGADGEYESPILKFHEDLEALKLTKSLLEKASKDISNMEATSKYLNQIEVFNRTLVEEHPMVAAATQELKTLLNTPGSKWDDINKAEVLLKERSMMAGTVKQRLATLDAKKAHLLSFKLPAEDIELVNYLYDDYVSRIQSLEIREITETNTTKHFDHLAKIVGTRLELRVNPDGTGKTGVERTFDGSGGKAWYIIASAVTAGTDTVEMFLKNRENGLFIEAAKFGVKVSQDKYKSVGQDKKDDGVVSDSLLAIKPAGSLHFNPEDGVEIDFITNW